ncbi:uncharacterized protein LOC107365434 [Tetranychus urticae]|uniref:Uncharacterized protein n=1 Tax=Tetranychus urticae TaxID=32264 RepID=T1JT82_TETUR|nr:uncharacterized protein LOC107365434 [Tetranychus urticae]
MNLYFFAPWIILAFMIAVVLTTLLVVHFFITLCFIEDNPDDKCVPNVSKSSKRNHKNVSGQYHYKLPSSLWLKWPKRKRSTEEIGSYIRSSSYCDLSVTSASYQPYPWIQPEMYQQSAHGSNEHTVDGLRKHSSFDSLTTTTTDTDFYRDWRHSIEFGDFTEYFNTNVDPKYKDNNQNVIYI